MVYYIHSQQPMEKSMDFIKNVIQNKIDAELKSNARKHKIKELEEVIKNWDIERLGYGGLRRNKAYLNSLKELENK